MASAETVTLAFSGQVGLGLGSIDSNDFFQGTLTYDTSVAATGTSNSTFAVFNAVTDFSFSVGSLNGSFMSPTGGPEIQIDNDPGAPFHDRFGLVSRVSDGLSPLMLDNLWTLTTVTFRLDDNTDSVFSDALVLPTSVDLSDFTSSQFFLFFVPKSDPQGFALISGSLNRLTTVPAPIPLPPAAPLAAGALGLLFALGRRRRARG